jgi:pullulanase/glycogen debranching enzyme
LRFNRRLRAYVRGLPFKCRSDTASNRAYEPEAGHRFNPHKLLLDPHAYAYANTSELTWHPALFGYQMETMDDLTFDERDSAPFMPKCVVVDPSFEWSEARGLKRIRWHDTIIYDMRVRGFTKQFPKNKGEAPRHLCRPRAEGRRRLYSLARSHLGRITPNSSLCE